MATRIPLVMVNGRIQQLQAGDTLTGAATGANGGGITITYTFSTTTTDSDPGAGVLRLDNATQNTATGVRADDLDNLGEDWAAVLQTLDDTGDINNTGTIRLVSVADPTKWLIFTVQAVIDEVGYKNIVVLPVSSSDANPFANNDPIILTFTATGENGLDGDDGADALQRPGFRLTPVSGDPDGTSTNTATIYYTPFEGGVVSVYNGAGWTSLSSAEVSVAVPSTLFRMYNVFAYDSGGGVLAIETENWTQTTGVISGATNATPIVLTVAAAHGLVNGDLIGVAGVGGNTAANGFVWEVTASGATNVTLVGSTGNGAFTTNGTWYKITGSAPATALTMQNGFLVKTGATDRLYVGMGMTGGTSGNTRVDASHCHLVNAFNQLELAMLVTESTSHTYASATVRPWNNNGKVHVSFLVPANKDTVALAVCNPLIVSSAGASVPEVGIGLNSVTVLGTSVVVVSGASITMLTPGANPAQRSVGYTLASAVELCPVGTGTFTQVAVRMGIKQ